MFKNQLPMGMGPNVLGNGNPLQMRISRIDDLLRTTEDLIGQMLDTHRILQSVAIELRSELSNNSNMNTCEQMPTMSSPVKQEEVFFEELNQPVKETDRVDWKKENLEREQRNLNLVVKQGWKKKQVPLDLSGIQKALKMYAGRCCWKVLRTMSDFDKKDLIIIRCDNFDSKDDLFTVRDRIRDEGVLLIEQDLTFVERKERFKMLQVATKLRAQGMKVIGEDRRIIVNGQPFTYVWGQGWERLPPD